MADPALVIQGGTSVIVYLLSILVLFVFAAVVMNWTEQQGR